MTCAITDSDYITNTPPIIISKISLFSKIAKHPNAAPRAREPVSPMNTFAGFALYHKKPMHAPIRDKQKINNSLLS